MPVNLALASMLLAVSVAAASYLPAQAQKSNNSIAKQDNSEEVVEVRTDLVVLQVRVVDDYNQPVKDARQDEFSVYDNDVPQAISLFSREEAPVSYGLVIGNTGSLQAQIGPVIGFGKTLIESNKPGDEPFFARFEKGDRTTIQWDFTPDKATLLNALDDLRVKRGTMALLDTVYLSAEHIAHGNLSDDPLRRRAMILLTDGIDEGSYYNPETVFERLREEDVQVYVVGFVDKLGEKKAQSVALINRLAETTGGRAFFPASFQALPEIAREIARDLRTQYVIGYRPSNNERDGSYHRVSVTLTDASSRGKRRRAITRAGYRARSRP